jgi:hypothetical protein
MMISVFMMYREQMPGLKVEFSGALGTNEPVNLQGLFPIGIVAAGGKFRTQAFENFVDGFIDCRFLETTQFVPTAVRASHDSAFFFAKIDSFLLLRNAQWPMHRFSKVRKYLSMFFGKAVVFTDEMRHIL